VTTDEEILAWVARDAEAALHPCGTCRMGRDPMAVVHPDTLSVHGGHDAPEPANRHHW